MKGGVWSVKLEKKGAKKLQIKRRDNRAASSDLPPSSLSNKRADHLAPANPGTLAIVGRHRFPLKTLQCLGAITPLHVVFSLVLRRGSFGRDAMPLPRTRLGEEEAAVCDWGQR